MLGETVIEVSTRISGILVAAIAVGMTVNSGAASGSFRRYLVKVDTQ
jgi:small neutral amino acid transporter SnatA (MarC family)